MEATITAVTQKRKRQALKSHKEAKEEQAVQKSANEIARVKNGTFKFDEINSSDSDFDKEYEGTGMKK